MEFARVVCDRGHRREIDVWCREAVGTWGLLREEEPNCLPIDARDEHERAVINDESKRGAKAVDPRGHVRLRGGTTRTKRGYRFECPTCGMNVPVRNRTLIAALDAAIDDGRTEVTLSELQHAGAPVPAHP